MPRARRRARRRSSRRRRGKVSGAFRFLRGGAERSGAGAAPPRGGCAVRCRRSPPSAFRRRATLRPRGLAAPPCPAPARRCPAASRSSPSTAATGERSPGRGPRRPAPRATCALPPQAAARSPPVPDQQPELRQQGPHGARAAELLPLHAAQVFGSPGHDWHAEEQQPEHVPGEEPLHRLRHLHHRLRAPGLPPQLQPQRALALQGPAALARTLQSPCGFSWAWENTQSQPRH